MNIIVTNIALLLLVYILVVDKAHFLINSSTCHLEK